MSKAAQQFTIWDPPARNRPAVGEKVEIRPDGGPWKIASVVQAPEQRPRMIGEHWEFRVAADFLPREGIAVELDREGFHWRLADGSKLTNWFRIFASSDEKAVVYRAGYDDAIAGRGRQPVTIPLGIHPCLLPDWEDAYEDGYREGLYRQKEAKPS